jgi:hypothetical protein
MKWLLTLLFCVIPLSIHADWVTFGAAYKCNTTALIVKSTIDASEGSHPAERGFNKLPKGDNKIQCAVGGKNVEVHMPVYEPAEGLDMGAGQAILKSLKVENTIVFEHLDFFSRHSMEPYPISIEIYHKGSSIYVKMCKAVWFYGEFDNIKCETKAMPR